ncbi:hypothetical protein CRYUN_Cryun07bG0046800 [Craigia yunnanensis]
MKDLELLELDGCTVYNKNMKVPRFKGRLQTSWNRLGMADHLIPTVDLSPFFREDDEDGKRKAMEVITKACSGNGFFQIVNHGVPINLLQQALELSRIFFEYPAEEKLKSSPASDAPLPAGYNTQPQHSPDKNEYLLMFPPGLASMFSLITHLNSKSIVNQCLGLPTNFLKEFNHDRSWDFMVALRYFPAAETGNNGLTEHEDGNCITFVFQDEAGGLEVCKDEEWVPVIPSKGTLVVNISDVIQGEKWVEPLPQFTKDIGQPSKYRGFQYNEYLQLRMKNKTHPPSRPKDEIRITHYKITT